MTLNTSLPALPSDGRIPVSLLTGFLGAGKTTLLNRLMQRPEMAGTVLFINEFGEVGVDQHLVETLDENTVLLDSGCLCCTMNGDLIAALRSLHERLSRREIPPVSRVLIETTGLADPVPVVNTLMENRHVNVRYVCDGVVTVVDATLGAGQLDRFAEARRQVSMADLILLGKSDLAPRAARAALMDRLARLNPTARRAEMRLGDIGPDILFGTGLYATDRATRPVGEWLGLGESGHSHGHDHALACDHGHGHDHHGPSHGGACGHSHSHEHEHDADCPVCAGGHDHDHAHDHPAAPVHSADGSDHPHEHHHDHAHGHTHGGSVGSFVVTFDGPVAWRSLAVTMGQILARHGAQLLRVKGLIRALGDAAPVVVQCVQDNAYAPVRLPRWPEEGGFADRRGRLVFITDGLAPEAADDIRARLADLPGDSAAVQQLALHPNLPTRCWLDARLPILSRGSFETDAWVVMPRGYRTAQRRA